MAGSKAAEAGAVTPIPAANAPVLLATDPTTLAFWR